MKRVLILTKTNWDEPPRIRHQITRLLIAKGYLVTYIEKNEYKNLLIRSRVEEGIQFYAHAELIHHQLRYFPLIQAANNHVVKFYLKRILKKIEFDFILNFCYDYHFLRKLAAGKKVITMIEDDFEAQAKFGMTRAIEEQVRKTCRNSDHVLTVSYPLMRKLKSYTDNVSMLFPWSQKHYVKPKRTDNRNTVLYYGFVYRIDWDMVKQLVQGSEHNFRFIGPTGKTKDVAMIDYLTSNCPNFEYIPFSKLSDLRLDDLFCSILPYDPAIKSVQACTVSNRAFNLLSLGLPLAYAALSELIKAPETVIRKNKTVEEYRETLRFFKGNFYDVQGDIEKFLSAHYQENRWSVLQTIIEKPLPVTMNKK